MSTLYIFATSERPDAYINTVAYAIEHRQATAIYIIVISEHDYAEEMQESELLASTVTSNINEQLRNLLAGKYIEKWSVPNNRDIVPLENKSNLEVYKRCLETMNRSGTTGIVVPLSNLDSRLRGYVLEGNCIVDVSALKKNLL